MTDEECLPISVWAGMQDLGDGKAYPSIIAKWSLSREDLEEIKKTNAIWIHFTALSLPPHSLSTENPFE